MNVVVLGMHRSGTSLLIGLLELHGFQLGEVSNQTSILKPTGTKENLEVRSLNNQIFKEGNSDWQNPEIPTNLSESLTQDIINQSKQISKIKNWALKDPRMLFTYSIWQQYLEGHKLIGTVRKPLDVALSLNKKNNIDVLAGLEIWYRYNTKLLSLWQKHRFPILVFGVAKDNYLKQTESIFEYLGIQFNYDKTAEFYQHKNLIHETLLIIPTHIQDLYNSLASLALNSTTV